MRTEMRRAAPLGAMASLAMALVLTACSTPGTDEGKVNATGSKAGDPGPAVVAVRQPPVVANPLAESGADRVFFQLDRYELSEQARGVVGKWGDYLRRQPNTRFMIEGHADERGTREYNLALAERRASAVR